MILRPWRVGVSEAGTLKRPAAPRSRPGVWVPAVALPFSGSSNLFGLSGPSQAWLEAALLSALRARPCSLVADS